MTGTSHFAGSVAYYTGGLTGLREERVAGNEERHRHPLRDTRYASEVPMRVGAQDLPLTRQ